MIFYILIGLVVIALVGVPIACYADRHEGVDALWGLLVGAVAALVPACIVGISWAGHARDLGTIDAQHEVISVYEERVSRLTERLDQFNYPNGSLLNADSPVASIVEALTEAESQLAGAEREKAEAVKSIEQRRYGPMSGVITFVGDYK